MALREYGGDQFLRSRLAVGTSDTDYSCTQLAAVVIGKLLQCLQAVVYEYISLIAFNRVFGFVDDSIGAIGNPEISGKEQKVS